MIHHTWHYTCSRSGDYRSTRIHRCTTRPRRVLRGPYKFRSRLNRGTPGCLAYHDRNLYGRMLIDACPQTRRNPHISFPAISLTGGAPTNQSLHPAVGGLDSLELFLHLCRSCEETLLENPSPNAARHIHPVSLSIGIDIMDYELKNRGHVAVERQQSNDGVAADCTQADYVDMRRLGTKQELRRNFRFTSILGFVAVAMGTWEVTLSATAAGLTNGGTGGMVCLRLKNSLTIH